MQGTARPDALYYTTSTAQSHLQALPETPRARSGTWTVELVLRYRPVSCISKSRDHLLGGHLSRARRGTEADRFPPPPLSLVYHR